MTPPGARRPALWGRPLALAALLAWGVSGCALQSDVLEMQQNVDAIHELQDKLQQQIADAESAAETMRAIGFRMKAVEEKVKSGPGAQNEGRITQGLTDLDKALKKLEAQRKEIDSRMAEAERFFVRRVEEVSAREQALSNRLAAIEAGGVPVPAQGAVPMDQAAELDRLGRQADASAQGVTRMQEQFALLTDRLARVTARQQATEADPEMARIGQRLTVLEAGGASDAEANKHLQEQIALLTDQVAALGAGRQDQAALSKTQAAQLSQRIEGAEGAAAENAAARTALATRVEALSHDEAEARAAQDRLTAQVQLLAERVGMLVAQNAEDGGPDPNDLADRLARLEGGEGQVQRLSQLTDQLALLGSQVTERLDAQANDFERLATRLDRIEQGVEAFQNAPPPWGEALDKKVSFLADELSPRVDTQGRELTALAQTVATSREGGTLDAAHLTERIDTLGTSLVQRMEALETRVSEADAAARARADAAVPPDLAAVNKRLDLLGKEMPGRVDDLTRVVGALRGHLQQMGERISLLETIQKQEASDLRERFNALSKALAEIGGSRAP